MYAVFLLSRKIELKRKQKCQSMFRAYFPVHLDFDTKWTCNIYVHTDEERGVLNGDHFI